MENIEFEQINEPEKPPEHENRYGGGQITKDRLGIYIATNPKILKDFNVDEEVYVLSKGTINHLYDQIYYYQKLNIYQFQIRLKYTQKLKNQNQQLQKRNKELQKTIIKLKEDISCLSAENLD